MELPVWQIILLVVCLIIGALIIFLLILYWLRYKKVRKLVLTPNSKVNQKKIKLPFKLDKFIAELGGIENIKNTVATNNKIKINVINHNKINFNELKKIKNYGILDQSDSISMVLGSYVNELSKIINDLINLHNEIK